VCPTPRSSRPVSTSTRSSISATCPRAERHKGGGLEVQDAHEAIRPTEVGLAPDDLKKYLERDLFSSTSSSGGASCIANDARRLRSDQGRLRAGGRPVPVPRHRLPLLFDGYHALYSEAHEPRTRRRWTASRRFRRSRKATGRRSSRSCRASTSPNRRRAIAKRAW